MIYDSYWQYIRPDAISVWFNTEVRRRLKWYASVMENKKPAKFLIAKRIGVHDKNIEGLDEEALWEIHDNLEKEFLRIMKDIVSDNYSLDELEKPRYSFLDVKILLAYKILEKCHFCERKCYVDRARGKRGACWMNKDVIAHSWFLHVGEEAPLVPSGTIFYGGCNFRCVYCQNYDISQTNPRGGIKVSPKQLAAIQKELRLKGARNINHVGGDPTPHLHGILESLRYLEINVPQLWNSNLYLTEEALKLLLHVIDIWLPDFKYGNNVCGFRLSTVPRYFDVVTRNLKTIVEHGDIIIRHLVLPGHLECCTKKALYWIAKNLPKEKVLVNIMDQYRPEHLVLRYPDKWPEITRRLYRKEVEEAYEYARSLGILFEPVS